MRCLNCGKRPNSRSTSGSVFLAFGVVPADDAELPDDRFNDFERLVGMRYKPELRFGWHMEEVDPNGRHLSGGHFHLMCFNRDHPDMQMEGLTLDQVEAEFYFCHLGCLGAWLLSVVEKLTQAVAHRDPNDVESVMHLVNPILREGGKGD